MRVAFKLNASSTGGLYARKRIPADVREDYARLYGKSSEERFCAPPDATTITAKRLAHEWRAEIEGRIGNLRAARTGNGQSLTRQQAWHLAEDWYVWFVGKHSASDDHPAGWEALAEEVRDAALPVNHETLPADAVDNAWRTDEAVKAAVRPIIADGAETSRFLATKGLVLDHGSRDLFLDTMFPQFAAALRTLIRRANGDLSTDPKLERPPQFQRDAGLTPRGLFARWVRDKNPARSTVDRWRAAFLQLENDFPQRGIGSITPDEARNWIQGLIGGTRTARTVKDVWLGASRSVCAWGVRHRLLSTNPFEDVPIDVPRRVKLRNKDFTDKEVQLILTASAAVTGTMNAFKAAKRWVPWVCAYTGARSGEILQLRGEDCQSALDRDPFSASKRDPFDRRVGAVAFAPPELIGLAKAGLARVV